MNECMERLSAQTERLLGFERKENIVPLSQKTEEGALSIIGNSWLSWPSEWFFFALTLSWDESSSEEPLGLSIGWGKDGKGKDELAEDEQRLSKKLMGRIGCNVAWARMCLNFHVPGIRQGPKTEWLYWIRSLSCSWYLNTLSPTGLEVAPFHNSSSSAEALSLELLLFQPSSSALSLRH